MKSIQALIQRFKQLPKRKKIQLSISTLLTAAFMIALPVVAWFVNYKKAASMVMVNAPTVLTIGAGANDVSDMIDLSNIDVEQKGLTNPTYSGEYVFAIRGKYLSAYDLQIARTTNIPFDYKIYRVSIVGNSGTLAKGFGTTSSADKESLSSTYNFAEYVATDGLTYYYPYITDTPVSGTLLNPKDKVTFAGDTPVKIGDGSTTLGDGTYHSHNYSWYNSDGQPKTDDEGHELTYDNVNEFAEPLYWQATDLQVNSQGKTDSGDFVDYYVLKLEWNESFLNTKETDMIYITAKRH